MSTSDNTKTLDNSEGFFPLTGIANDGYSNEDEATATCLCGAVQLAFPTSGPGFVDSFVCHCTDCHKITASMFASNFIISNKYLKHLRGQENLKTFSQNHSIGSGKLMTNYFCSTCGTLLYRIGERWPQNSILRIGTIDDFKLHESKMKPKLEQFTRTRVDWLTAVEGLPQYEGSAY